MRRHRDKTTVLAMLALALAQSIPPFLGLNGSPVALMPLGGVVIVGCTFGVTAWAIYCLFKGD